MRDAGRSERTRDLLVRATAQVIAQGRPADAGLVTIVNRAGVSRGALYHHFPSTTELIATVYRQARCRVLAMARARLVGPASEGLGCFLAELGREMTDDEVVRAGMQLAADGTTGPPALRDEVLALVRTYMLGQHGEDEPASAPLVEVAELVTAGVTTVRFDAMAFESQWQLLKPLFAAARAAPGRSPAT
ncbi:TetR family transcriptional regulator [Streptomyces sp. NPDC088354]|uniref:TetR family transcriptional regulator n=1 Tax=Streptomyces sp. NPDC088354 TaxID=3365856 RepID=UPI0038253C3D